MLPEVDCVFVSVAVPERRPFPADVLGAEAKTRIGVFETRPQFEKQILEERRALKHTHVADDWFVLFDVGATDSGISTCFVLSDCWFAHGPSFFAFTNMKVRPGCPFTA